jgi:hypothetical protein
MAADTSSAAAACTCTVGASAAALAALIADLMDARSVAADVSNSGRASMNDMAILPMGLPGSVSRKSAPWAEI